VKVLLTGASGQLGRELAYSRPQGVNLVAVTSAQLDIADASQVDAILAEVAPQIILNAAAYTAVDRAEAEEARALEVNATGVANLSIAARRLGSRLIHVSTDFVFDGGGATPYRPADATGPVSAYGRTKLAGERSALETLGDRATVIRTSWLYSAHGRNFVATMLDLMADREALQVVDDQTGSPTWAALLARCLWRMSSRPDLHGLWHWADGGSCTWFEFARSIQSLALERGLLDLEIPIEAVTTAEFPTPAARPGYSVLDTSATYDALDLEPVPWRDALGRMLDEMRERAASR